MLSRASRRWTIVVAALLTALLIAASAPALPVHADTVAVIVRSATSADAARAVERAGGEVTAPLAVIGGVAATVTDEAARTLRSTAGVVSVTEDAAIHLLSDTWGETSSWESDESSTTTATPRSDDSAATRAYEPESDVHSVYSALDAVGALSYWDAGYTGEGVGVALIDTGVVPVEGLDDPGQVYYGPDLSFESQSDDLRHLDSYGHGTHMAGLINGRDTGASPATVRDNPGAFMGIAPDAHLVSVKVAAHNGVTDISQVIAAIDWVVANADDPSLNIRVLNLSFGVYSGQPAAVDPLVHAAEAAWQHGIVVVAAAGNDGDTIEGLASPAYSPRLIAVGAGDPQESADHRSWIPLAFSAVAGPDGRAADILAPGSRLTSLRSPGSYLDLNHPGARVGERFFRGSGTSQAAALVSGAAALLLSQHRDWSPDQVKGALLQQGEPLDRSAGFSREDTGDVGLDLDRIQWLQEPRRGWSQRSIPAALGGGSIDLARGGAHVVLDGVVLEGEQDIFGNPLDTEDLAARQRHRKAFDRGVWNGTRWTGGRWEGDRWQGAQWTGTTWSGAQWTGTTWSGAQWTGNRWSGDGWSGAQWTGAQWTGAQWTGAQWTGTTWSNAHWG